MSTLAGALKKYLQLRRNLGSKLQGADRILRNFVAFAKREGSSHITTDLALRWAQEPLEACRSPGCLASGWYEGSHSGSARPIHERKCRLRGFCPTVINVGRRTSIAMRRSRRLSGRLAAWSLPKD